ncbi:MAG: hypothetical protein R3C12_21315 [Planctomycetaceae bacterium]|nr:hypothetical protein [Planctomycetaceae bacterium]
MRKKLAVFGCLITLCGLLLLPSATAMAQATHDDARQKFEQLKGNTQSSSVEKFHSGARFSKPDQGRFDIDPVDNFDGSKKPFHCGIAVWFQLENGRYVNPTKHRWNPGERFHVWIEPAVPVTISLHQNYPDDRPPSKQVYPDARYPKTFRDFRAGERSKLPVRFRMDDDLRDEIMSMVVVRCDSGALPIHMKGQANLNDDDDTSNTGTSGIGAVLRNTVELQTRFNNEAFAQDTINGQNSRFVIIGPDKPDCPEISDDFRDVQFFMFGDGFHHQFQITLKK